MIKTPEDKKKEILAHLEKNAITKNWFLLSKKRICKMFADPNLDEDNIIDILKELEKQDIIRKSRVGFSIIYLKKDEKHIKTKLKQYLKSSLNLVSVILAFYFTMLSSAYPPIYDWFKNNFGATSIQDFFIFGVIFGIFIFFCFLGLFITLFKYIQEKIPLIQQHGALIKTGVIFTAFLISAVYIYSFFAGEYLSLGYIIMLIGISIASTLSYYGIKAQKKKI